MRLVRAIRPSACIAALWLTYAFAVYRTAWLSDDAFITLRTVSNALHGDGLCWNVAERVQTYTHPLWMFCLLGAHAIGGEPFYASLYVSWLVSCAAVAILFVSTRGGPLERVLALVLLIFSKAFVEFSTSGLENPLTHLWLACFVALYVKEPERGDAMPLSAIVGLAALTRLDSALLLAPAWLLRLRARPWSERFVASFVAASPLAAWLAFSVIYYGFPWPNTAYAKLGTGDFAGMNRLAEAAAYFKASLRADPLTLGSWLAIAALFIYRRDRARLALLAGSALSLGYVVWIGGDFMSGRFFSAPFFLAVACLASSDLLSTTRLRLGALALAAALIALGQRPPLFTGAGYGVAQARQAVNAEGIHDARAEFFQNTSLSNAATMNPAHADHPWSARGHALRERALRDPAARVQVIDAIGFAGYYAGPLVHIVDHWALADPLLARLPASFGALGHYPRAIPDGYIETLAGGDIVLRDPELARYYAQLQLVTRGNLFTAERWRAIWALNTGAYAALLHRASYVETTELTASLRITNVTDYPDVSVYVWNDFRQASYVLDEHSHRGAVYDVRWRVRASGPELLSPALRQTSSFRELRAHGMFTLSAVFSRALEPGKTDIHELQYRYRRSGAVLTFLRNPAVTRCVGFPFGVWETPWPTPALERLNISYE